MPRILLFCLLKVLFLSAAQAQPALQLQDAEPKAGQEIHFTYIGGAAKVLLPGFRIYFVGDGPVKWTTASGKATPDGVKASFKLPEGTDAFCIRPERYK